MGLYREALAIEGYGLGRCVFILDLPVHLLKARESYTIVVRAEDSRLHLPGSSYVLGPAMQMVQKP